MATHDPQQLAAMLRDHLAAHDKRLVFLFGAGTSSSVNVAPPAAPGERQSYVPLIPAVDGLTDACAAAVLALPGDAPHAWQRLIDECNALGKKPHIENLLSRLRLKIDSMGPTDRVLGIDLGGLKQIEDVIRSTIAKVAAPPNIPDDVPHDRFARWVRNARRRYPVEIFTTNYDVLVERSLDRARVPVFDGFIGSYNPYFSPGSCESEDVMPGYEWARLWKLHGSVNWRVEHDTVVRGQVSAQGEMILPSHRKYDESRKLPYLALLDRLGRCLSNDGALLVTCGYSWSDEHINDVILSALDGHPSSHAVALLYAPLTETEHLAVLASGRDNLVVVAPREGIYRAARGAWMLHANASSLRSETDDATQPPTRTPTGRASRRPLSLSEAERSSAVSSSDHGLHLLAVAEAPQSSGTEAPLLRPRRAA